MADKSMADDELITVELRDNFYRDSFNKVIFVIFGFLITILLLLAVAFYLHLNKPKPVTFFVGDDWHVQSAVALDQPFLTTTEMLQWVSNVIPTVFTLDFINYDKKLQSVNKYFTSDGWKSYLDELNIYVNYNNVLAYKLFINAQPTGAPFVLNQGLLSGRYAWWVQMPLDLRYSGNKTEGKLLILQVLIVRVSTLNNLMGIGIDKIIEIKDTTRNPPPTATGPKA